MLTSTPASSTATTPSAYKHPKKTASLLAYFDQLQDFFVKSGVSDQTDTLYIFKTGLSGEDYERYVLHKDLPSTFKELKDLLLEVHEPQETQMVLADRFHSSIQLPGERVRAFAGRLKTLASRAYPTLSADSLETLVLTCLLYTSPSPRDLSTSRMPSSA